jgi:hypothetical protein
LRETFSKYAIRPSCSTSILSSANGLIMEDSGGRALNHVISSQKLGVKDVLQRAISIADTLDRVHSSGVIHMDVKPHNRPPAHGERRQDQEVVRPLSLVATIRVYPVKTASCPRLSSPPSAMMCALRRRTRGKMMQIACLALCVTNIPALVVR